MSSLLPVVNVRKLLGSHVTWSYTYTLILGSVFTCDVCKKSVKQSGTS